ncbi:helix-turn-helix transcriptional regulator [Vallitalea pronyensis]|uniref:Helix-turn-helix transcriptional regulator n=1 Tax=Vallitalea pronyensis TaxID=1348613 RepID=A0A8J8SJ75_9FIRM|nr:helix-turn-helix transcriptional regulator [Vallitalea pronyensis]
MVLVNELKGRIVAKGLTQEKVADILGITVKTINSKLNNKGDFRISEIEQLIEVLEIDNPMGIFFVS